MPEDDAHSLIPADLVEEYAEIGADKLVEEARQYVTILDPLGSEIPYFKKIVAAIKLPRTISDFILGKKVYAFLYSSGLDDAKIEKFKRKFSKAKQEKLWEQVVFSINMHDDRLKAEIVGKLFNALLEETILEDEFFTMVHATNSINVHVLDDLKDLYTLSGNVTLSGSRYYTFVTNGLIDIDNSQIGTIGGGGPVYPLNQIGWKYVGIVFDHPDSAIDGYKVGDKELIVEYDSDSQQTTGNAYPLDFIKSKGSMYREADLFIVNEDGHILCDSTDGLPNIFGSVIPIAGEQPQQAIQRIADTLRKEAHPMVIRRMEDVKIQKWSYIVKSNQAQDGTQFRSISDINQTINQTEPKTDHTRYLVQVVEQIERHVAGELKEQWEKF
jgi:hypothetical protein